MAFYVFPAGRAGDTRAIIYAVPCFVNICRVCVSSFGVGALERRKRVSTKSPPSFFRLIRGRVDQPLGWRGPQKPAPLDNYMQSPRGKFKPRVKTPKASRKKNSARVNSPRWPGLKPSTNFRRTKHRSGCGLLPRCSGEGREIERGLLIKFAPVCWAAVFSAALPRRRALGRGPLAGTGTVPGDGGGGAAGGIRGNWALGSKKPNP
jgi:hypothetical protein